MRLGLGLDHLGETLVAFSHQVSPYRWRALRVGATYHCAPLLPRTAVDQGLAMSRMSRQLLLQRDEQDPLAARRSQFSLPKGEIYLDGNSLGALVSSVAPRMHHTIQQEWGRGLIRSRNDAQWYPAPLRLGATFAGLVGAQAHEVVV